MQTRTTSGEFFCTSVRTFPNLLIIFPSSTAVDRKRFACNHNFIIKATGEVQPQWDRAPILVGEAEPRYLIYKVSI